MNTQYSIHILNHNYDPDPILGSLSRQIIARDEDIQLFLWDDFSNAVFRQSLYQLQSKYNQPFVTWNLEQENSGRSSMRQKILRSGHGDWLVSIDSDMLPDIDFIGQMISTLQDETTVYTGRHYYQKVVPAPGYRLHWNYGVKREVLAREQDPYLHFSTGIFAVHHTVKHRLYFDEKMTEYGHEDTLFGLLLQQLNIPVTDSPMRAMHVGLSETDIFIEKQVAAARNLRIVVSRYPDYNSRLVQWAHRLEKIPLLRSLISSDRFRSHCAQRLRKNPENLLMLDLLKLSAFLTNGRDLQAGGKQAGREGL